MVGGRKVPPIGPCRRTLYPASPSLQWVPWVSVPHLLRMNRAASSSRYSVPLRLPSAPLVVLRLALVPRYRACFLRFRVSVAGSLDGGSGPPSARAFGRPLPHAGTVTRRQGALPRSRATPLPACPALRPRWCPRRSPKRVWDCCLPATGNRRLSPLYRLERYPTGHHATHFGAPSRRLPARSLQLRPPMAGRARGVRYRPAGSAFVGWDLSFRSHPLGNNNQFHENALNSKGSGFPWRDQWVVRLGTRLRLIG